ncbi:M20 family metallopeptidase [Nanoarchaeota archaeon]
MQEIIELTRKLVSFRSTEDNPSELRACADYIAGYFDGLDLLVERFEHKGIPSVYVSLNKTRTPKLILNAHFDVVPADDEMFEMKQEDNKLFGRGVNDDKGPLAIIMVLLKELAQSKEKPDVAMLVTGDEEIGGHNGIQHVLEQEKVISQYAIVLDGGSLNKYITKAKGICNMHLTSNGVEAHGSRPWQGENAIVKLIKAYSRIDKLFQGKDQWDPTCSLNIIKGGETENKIPSKAKMALDIRYPDKKEMDSTLKEIMKIIDDEGLDVKTTGRPPLHCDEDNAYFKELLRISTDVFGEKAEASKAYGGSDATYLMNAGIQCALTKTNGGGSHSSDEFMELEGIGKLYEVLKRFCLSIENIK